MALVCLSAPADEKILKWSNIAAVYQDVPDHFLIPYIEFGNNEFIFQYDIAPSYTMKSSKEWFKEETILVFDWLVNSPDANPKENLYGILQRRLRKYYPSNLEELKLVITEVWALVSLETSRDLFSLSSDQMKEIENPKGITTKY